MSDWYVRAGVHEHGPISDKKLEALARRGQIKRTFLIREGADGTWCQADRVEGLLDTTESESNHVVESPSRQPTDLNRTGMSPEQADESAPVDDVSGNEVGSTDGVDVVGPPPVAAPHEPTGEQSERIDGDWSRASEPPPVSYDALRTEPPHFSTPPAASPPVTNTESMAARSDASPRITHTDNRQRPIPDGNSQGAGSVILGILSLVLSVVPFVGMAFGLAGAWLGFRGRGIASGARVIPSGLTFTGVFISMFGVLVSSISTVLFMVFFFAITSAIAALIHAMAGGN